MIGRGLRKSENTGKIDCHIIDMVANLSHGVVTTPTLFGLDPDMLINEMTPEKMVALAAKEAEARRKAREEEEKRRVLESQAEQERARAEEESRMKEDARIEEEVRKMKEEIRTKEEEAMKAADRARVRAQQAALEAEREQAEKEMEEAKGRAEELAKTAGRLILQEEGRLRAIAAEKFNRDALAKVSPALPIQLEYTDYDDIWDLLSDTRADQVVYSVSRLAWVSIGPTKYVLGCGGNGHITVEMDSNGFYNVEEVRALPLQLGRGRWARPKLIMTGIEQLDPAIRGAGIFPPSHEPAPTNLIISDRYLRSKDLPQTSGSAQRPVAQAPRLGRAARVPGEVSPPRRQGLGGHAQLRKTHKGQGRRYHHPREARHHAPVQ